MESQYVFDTEPKILNDAWITKIRKIVGINGAAKKNLKRSNRYREARFLRLAQPFDIRMLIPLRWI